MKLGEVQHAVAQAVVGKRVDVSFVKPGRLAAQEHLDVYAGMYPLRMHDALLDDLPHTVKLLGDDFSGVLEAYAGAHPSTHHSLSRFGDAFVPFLHAHLPATARADLADLAALEQAHAHVFVERDASRMELAALAALPPEALADLTLRALPSVRMLTLEHPVLELWTALKQEATLPPVGQGRLEVVVWRKGFEVFHVEVSAPEAQALRLVLGGATLEALCAPFADAENPAAEAFKAIGSWVNEGMIAA